MSCWVSTLIWWMIISPVQGSLFDLSQMTRLPNHTVRFWQASHNESGFALLPIRIRVTIGPRDHTRLSRFHHGITVFRWMTAFIFKSKFPSAVPKSLDHEPLSDLVQDRIIVSVSPRIPVVVPFQDRRPFILALWIAKFRGPSTFLNSDPLRPTTDNPNTYQMKSSFTLFDIIWTHIDII